ncbi:DotU family type IV/VI secretion system protein [Aliidiomarina soli]|uniref:Type IV / VI secretion system DotU domain-containing protein n=1 Tax=Aliidiomarina soli TaxID=1928574 RepID=A0A432WJ85_9GAMM|nr:DotU family type IV/VI secretion system protein [Aliidiomarina soli]RUO33739.1 hypothetical protein CWE14_04545 [Aliidiomarina soli]
MNKHSMQVIMDLSSPVHYLVSDLGQYPRQYNEVMAEINEHIGHSRSVLAEIGLSDEQVDAIVYATAALADEIVMRSAWKDKAQWARQPLCVRLFGDARAGRHFFDRVHTLRAAPVTNALPLWHFWRCIQLGFEGQYRNTDGRALRDVVLSLESGLSEAGFIPSASTAPSDTVLQESGWARPAWPLHRYLLVSAIVLPVLIFSVSDLILFGTLEQLHNFIQSHADNLQTKSGFITP